MSKENKSQGSRIEVKLGMTVIALLVIVLGVVAFRQFSGERPPAAQIGGDASQLSAGYTPSASSLGQTTVLSANPPSGFGGSTMPHDDRDPTTSLMPVGSVNSPRDEVYTPPSTNGTELDASQPSDIPGAYQPARPLDISSDLQGSSQQSIPQGDVIPVAGETPQPTLSDSEDRYGAASTVVDSTSPQQQQTFRQNVDTAPLNPPPSDWTQASDASTQTGPAPAAEISTTPASGNAAVFPDYSPATQQPQGIQTTQSTAPTTGAFQTAPPAENAYTQTSQRVAASVANAVGQTIPGEYVVAPGDSMWQISRKVYGTGSFFKALQEHNKRRYPNPNDLQVGDVVLTPDVAKLREKYPYLSPKERPRAPASIAATGFTTTAYAGGRTYVVEEGDTLFDIAKYELGSGARWPEIYQLNSQSLGGDFDYLRPGTPLALPAAPASRNVESVAELPGATLRQ